MGVFCNNNQNVMQIIIIKFKYIYSSKSIVDVLEIKNSNLKKEKENSNEEENKNENNKQKEEQINDNINRNNDEQNSKKNDENYNKNNNITEKEENLNDKNNESEKLLFPKEKPTINFDSLYQEIKESEIEACQTRIETYELKGFNSMEPTIKINNDIQKEMTLVSSLLEKKNIDLNYIELMKLTENELSFFDKIHYGKLKFKQNFFDKIIIDEIKLNKYGNINLVNCIYMLVKKDKNYFKNLFVKFDIENNEFEYKCYQGGLEEIFLFGNKVIKNTEFIHPSEGNFWIFLVEKSLEKIYKH